MRKAKLMLSGIAVMAVVGGAFAFNAHKFLPSSVYKPYTTVGGVPYCTTTNIATTTTGGVLTTTYLGTTTAFKCTNYTTARTIAADA